MFYKWNYVIDWDLAHGILDHGVIGMLKNLLKHKKLFNFLKNAIEFNACVSLLQRSLII